MSSTLYVLLGAVLFLLLVACANVTNLLLSQAAARGRELAIRHALGARRALLIRQFMAEAFVLLAAGCVAGLLVAWAGISVLLSLAPADLPRLEEVSLNGPVLGFAVALSSLVAIALGLVTATRATARDPRETLSDGGRAQAGASNQRVGRAIVAAQLAITVVLLVGAALLGRSLLRVLSVNPGFRTEGLVAMDLNLPDSSDPTAKARLSPFYTDLFNRLRAIPGVEEVAGVNAVPMDGGLPDGLFLVMTAREAPAKPDDLKVFLKQKDRTGTADYCAASPDYFRALGIPLIRGRLFDDRDQFDQPHVALISESLAKSRWPGEDPLGRMVEFGNMDGDLRLLTIVGHCRRHAGVRARAASATDDVRQSPAETSILDHRRAAIECRSAVHHVRGPRGAARSRAGGAAALPYVRADLRRVARSAAVQPDARRRVRRNGPHSGGRGDLRRHGLRRHSSSS